MSPVASGARAAPPPTFAPASRMGASAPWWLILAWVAAGMATIGLLVVLRPETAFVGLVTATIFLSGGIVLVRTMGGEDTAFLVRLYTTAFLARYAFAVLVLSAMSLAGVSTLEGGLDYIYYEQYGWRLAENWRAGNPVFAVHDKDPGYYYLIALLYTFTGRYLIAPTLLNALFGGLAAVLVFRIAREIFDRRAAVIAGLLAALLPILLFWSSLLYKDTILSCTVVWAFYLAIRLRREPTTRNAVWLGVAFLPPLMMRPETGATVAATVFVLIMANTRRYGTRVTGALLAFLLVLVLMFSLQMAGLGGKTEALGRFVNPITGVFEHREAWGDAVQQHRTTGISKGLYGRNLLREPHLLVVATAMPFVLPIPGTGSIGMNFNTFLLPGQIVWLALLPALVYGSIYTIRKWTAERVLLLAFAASSALGVALAGYFGNPRYLIQVVPVMLIFVGVGIRDLRHWLSVYFVGVCAAVAAIASYGLIKGM